MNGLYQRRRKRPEMNLVPLIDVLVMLIFFAFVTMQFKSATTLNIKLPKFTTAGKNDFKDKVEIDIGKNGEIAFNGRTIADDDLAPLLRQAHDADSDIPVLIRADETTQLKKLAFVMDACRSNGLSKFSLQSR